MSRSSNPRNNGSKPRNPGGPRKRSYRRSNTNQTVPPSDSTLVISVDADINFLEQTNNRAHAKPTDKIGEIEVVWVHNAHGAVVGPLFFQETEEEPGSPVRVIDVAIPIAGGRDQSATKITPVLTLFVNKTTGWCQIDEGESIPKGLGSTQGWTLTLKVERITGGSRV
jgi:hypothetical protein